MTVPRYPLLAGEAASIIAAMETEIRECQRVLHRDCAGYRNEIQMLNLQLMDRCYLDPVRVQALEIGLEIAQDNLARTSTHLTDRIMTLQARIIVVPTAVRVGTRAFLRATPVVGAMPPGLIPLIVSFLD